MERKLCREQWGAALTCSLCISARKNAGARPGGKPVCRAPARLHCCATQGSRTYKGSFNSDWQSILLDVLQS